jgi:hypothetical protein
MAKNTICLWDDKDAEAAAHFYSETFPTAKWEHEIESDSPDYTIVEKTALKPLHQRHLGDGCLDPSRRLASGGEQIRPQAP